MQTNNVAIIIILVYDADERGNMITRDTMQNTSLRDLFSGPAEERSMNSRVLKILSKRLGLETVEDLVLETEKVLRDTKGFHDKTLAHVKKKLAEHSLELCG